MNITSYQSVPQNQIEEARAAGLLLHHEEQWETRQVHDEPAEEAHFAETGDLMDFWTTEEVKIRDEWFAAHPDWVANYHANGGTWAYAD